MKFFTTLVLFSFTFVLGLVSVHCERSDHRCGPSVGNPPCGNGRCCSVHGWCGGAPAYCKGKSCDYQCWTVGRSRPIIAGVSELIGESLYNEMFKHMEDCPSKGFYTYEAFVAAAEAFPGFCTTGDAATRRRELAAFLALVSQLTAGERPESADSHSWGLCHINTTAVGSDESNEYCTSSRWPCSYGKKYNSRGPIQLTHNYNYGLAGEALGLDLINDPDMVATDAVASFKTAVWFWMARHDNKPSRHDLLVGAAASEPGQVPSYEAIENAVGIGLRGAEYYERYYAMLEGGLIQMPVL